MTGPSRLSSVPKVMLLVYEKIVGLTDDVCDRYLNTEYRDLARAMTAALCRKRPSPLASGQPRTWACGIVYALGRVNFLSDKSFSPYMTTADLWRHSGQREHHSRQGARYRKSDWGRVFDPRRFQLGREDPLFWMAEVNGLLVDLRDMPREVQEIAFEDGLISYIPRIEKTDRERNDGKSLPQAPAQESPEGTARLADCDNCVLRPELAPGDEGHRWHRSIRECRGRRVARLEG